MALKNNYEGDLQSLDDGYYYECHDCGDEYALSKILIVEGGDRVVCAGCSKPEDRII